MWYCSLHPKKCRQMQITWQQYCESMTAFNTTARKSLRNMPSNAQFDVKTTRSRMNSHYKWGERLLLKCRYVFCPYAYRNNWIVMIWYTRKENIRVISVWHQLLILTESKYIFSNTRQWLFWWFLDVLEKIKTAMFHKRSCIHNSLNSVTLSQK